MSNILQFPVSARGVYRPEFQPQTAKQQPIRLYNVFKGKELVYGSGSLGQCMRFVAVMVEDASGVVLVAEAIRYGYQIRAAR